MSSRRRVVRLGSAALLLAIQALVAPAHVLAVGNTLSNGSVNPTTGTIATTFAFHVDYTSDQGFEATSVWAEVGGTAVPLQLVSGTAVDGTFSGSSTLPAGSWPVTFHADAVRGSDPTLAGPTLTVIDPNAPPPPTPNPPPTAGPTLLPVPPPTPTLPFESGAPSATSSGRPSGSPEAPDQRAPTPEPSTEGAEPADDASTRRGSPWLFVGGGMSAIGAAILVGNWAGRRRRRPARP